MITSETTGESPVKKTIQTVQEAGVSQNPLHQWVPRLLVEPPTGPSYLDTADKKSLVKEGRDKWEKLGLFVIWLRVKSVKLWN